MAERIRKREVAVERVRCPFCHESIEPSEDKVACNGCMGWHHAACWSEHSGCSACSSTQAAAPREEVASAPRGATEGPERDTETKAVLTFLVVAGAVYALAGPGVLAFFSLLALPTLLLHLRKQRRTAEGTDRGARAGK